MALSKVNPSLVQNLPGRKNILINGGFEISQRGSYTSATAYNDGTYHIDRWETLRDGVTATIQHLVPVAGESSYGVKLTATSATNGTIRLRQRLEVPNIYIWGARTFTLSARVKSNSSNARLMMYGGSGGGYVTMTSDSNDSHTGGGAIETLTATFTTTGSVSSEFAAFVGIDNARSVGDPAISSGDYFEVYDFQMEEGTHASDFENRSYGEELALCQRYYEKVLAGPSSSYIGWSAGTVYGAGTYLGHFTATVPMRTTPTFSTNAYDSASKMSVVSGADTYAISSIAVTGNNQRLRINADASLSGIIGQGAYLQVQNGYYVAFEAEL